VQLYENPQYVMFFFFEFLREAHESINARPTGVFLHQFSASGVLAAMVTNELTIIKPDDFHHHFRDGDALKSVVPLVASRFRRAIAMPNLKPPVTTTTQAVAYRNAFWQLCLQGRYSHR